MSGVDDPRRPLFNMLDVQADDIMSLSDEDVLREVREAGLDPGEEARRVRAQFTKIVAAAGRSRLETARVALEARRGTGAGNVLTLPVGRKAQIVAAFAANDVQLRSRVTIAARQGDGASEREIDSILRDLRDLGAIDDEGNPI